MYIDRMASTVTAFAAFMAKARSTSETGADAELALLAAYRMPLSPERALRIAELTWDRPKPHPSDHWRNF
jgi:hypothetical protein